MNRSLGAIEMFDKGRQTALVKELVFFLCALVFDGDLDAAVKERQLTQSLRENIETKFGRFKNFTIGLKRHPRAALFGLADLFQTLLRVTPLITLLIDFSIALDLDFQSLGQCVDDRNTHAVQTAGDFVRGFVELAAGVELGEHDFGGGNVFSGMDVDGDAATIVDHRDAVIDVNGDFDRIAMSHERFIDGVINDFKNEMVQTPLTGIADVHARSFSDRLQAF